MAGRSSFSRRALLFAGASLPFAATSGAALADQARTKTLVCICLRGAVDGLSIAVPYTEAKYYEARPTIAVARPGAKDGALDLDGRFGLHPRLSKLHSAYRAGELALVHAVGSPHPTRSHFEAQDYLETALPGDRAANQGFFARCLLQAAGDDQAVRAVGLGNRAPLALRGFDDALCVKSLKQLKLSAEAPLRDRLEDGFRELYAAGDDRVAVSGRRALELGRRLRPVVRATQDPEKGASYPKSGRALAEVAALIKGGVGLEVAWIDVGGWDTHRGQGDAVTGALARQFDQLGQALAAFRADVGQRFEHVLVLVMSEFGRTVRQNGTGGTDHGHGGVMLLMGGGVRGRKVYGRFPGLADDQLFEGRDLSVTTDYRAILAEVAQKQLGIGDLSSLLPGHDARAHPPLNVLR